MHTVRTKVVNGLGGIPTRCNEIKFQLGWVDEATGERYDADERPLNVEKDEL